MKRLMIKLGFHGKRHRVAEEKMVRWMSQNGLGA